MGERYATMFRYSIFPLDNPWLLTFKIKATRHGGTQVPGPLHRIWEVEQIIKVLKEVIFCSNKPTNSGL